MNLEPLARRLSFYRHTTESHWLAMNKFERAYWMGEARTTLRVALDCLPPGEVKDYNWFQRFGKWLFRL